MRPTGTLRRRCGIAGAAFVGIGLLAGPVGEVVAAPPNGNYAGSSANYEVTFSVSGGSVPATALRHDRLCAAYVLWDSTRFRSTVTVASPRRRISSDGYFTWEVAGTITTAEPRAGSTISTRADLLRSSPPAARWPWSCRIPATALRWSRWRRHCPRKRSSGFQATHRRIRPRCPLVCPTCPPSMPTSPRQPFVGELLEDGRLAEVPRLGWTGASEPSGDDGIFINLADWRGRAELPAARC